MTLLEAALETLRLHGGGKPMHYRAIAERAVADGLVSPRGLTPEASLNAAITSDINRRSMSGDEELFVAYGRGLYGLARNRTGTEIEEAIRSNNTDVREYLMDQLKEMHPRSFEDLIGRLLTDLGFVDVEVTAYSGDGGIDVRGTLAVGGVTNVKTAIQVKRWVHKVSGRTVRELRGGLSAHERGLVITTSKFTRDALREAQISDRAPISLVDGERLADLLIEHGIGVIRTEARILQFDVNTLLQNEGEQPIDLDPEEGEGPETAEKVPTPLGRERGITPRSSKNLSLWPLPGGQGHYVESLDKMLLFVSETEPVLDAFVSWMIDSFEKVKSIKSAQGYIEVLRYVGLIQARAGRLVLTTDGASYLASGEREELFRVMAGHIAGFEETLDALGEKGATAVQVTQYLNDLLGTSWDTPAQATWRLRWLEECGKLRRSGDTYYRI